MNPTTPYRFHEFYSPGHPPFEAGASHWPTVVMEFIAPLFRDEKDAVFWILDHGTDFQVCFASDDFARIEVAMEKRREAMKLKTKSKPSDGATVATALSGSRWLANSRHGDAAAVARRSVLLLRSLHACTVLFIDQLVQEGDHWFIEANRDENNPLGHSFESVFHLMGNLSHTEIEVRLFGATQLMKPTAGGKVRIRL